MMKKIGILIILIGIAFTTRSQSECEKNYAIYRNEYNQKNYEEALKSWRKVFNNCPDFNQYTFTNGVKMYQYMIKQDKENKISYLDTIMLIYDTRIQYFGNKEKIFGDKGSDLLKYDPDRFIEAYEMMKMSLEFTGNSTKPTVLVSYFKSLVKYQRSDVTITKQDVLDAYVQLSDVISYNINNNPDYSKYYLAAQKNIENMFAPYASCDDLILVFESRLKEENLSVSVLKKITSLLDKKNCTDNEVFFTAASKLHDLEPTASSSYDMGNTSLAKKNYSAAVEYFTQAIEMTEDLSKKASYYLKLSYSYQMIKSYSKARDAAINASKLKPEWGEPYIIIGDLYASSATKCGSTSLEQRSVYWVAVDAYKKAKSIDNLLSEKANKRISTWSKQFPSKEDCIWEDISEGSTYKVGCWIGRSTKVRTRD